MAAKQRNDLLDRLLYAAIRGFSGFLHCFPIALNLQVARGLGTLMYAVDRKHRNRALQNLRHAFPGMPEVQVRTMARQSMGHLAMLGVEVLFTTRLIRMDTWRSHVELDNFQPVLDLLIRQKTGLLMLTGHYGNWEVLGYVLATLGFETTSVARPLDNPYVNRWLLGVREKQGQRIVAKKGATADVIDVLEDKGAVGLIADQNAGSKGVFVDFFGRKASTYKSIALLAMQYNVPVVIGYARRSVRPFFFHIGAQDIIYPEDWASQDDPLRYITQRYTAAIEQMVRQDPAQYLWVHRRWKSRPKGEQPETYD
jgi:Kdo2-lipid IVA lauroyltransferase/acyltransferase